MPIDNLAPVIIDTDEPDAVAMGDEEISISLPDGNVVIDLNPGKKDEADSKFDDNLAMEMGAGELAVIANGLLDGINADIQSRSEWEATRTRGIQLLGLKLEEPRGSIDSASPVEGMSQVRHPLLLEAVLRAQANASGELLPANGPAKIKNDGDETAQADQEAEDLEKGFNHYLTKTATEYYPDTRRTLFWSSFGGSSFKKLYHCPIRRRPVSESVDANDLIVSNAATDLQNAPRLTHRIKMPPSIMKRMQLVNAYRDVTLSPPGMPTANAVDQAKQNVEGVRPAAERPEDQPYELYETYCELILDAYAPTQFKGKELPLPYKVTLDKESQQVLEVRRFWQEDDDQCLRKKRIVKYPYVEGWGLYGIGLVHILGNSTNALTAAWREALDAGMFASFPGGLMLKAATKQMTNEIRVGPGSWFGLDSPSQRIQDVAMALPYKDVTPGLMTLIDKINEASSRVGGTAELPIGEGKQDAPVGTTLALLEQQTKIESAVHKGLHTAQAEEFEILIELFREDPEAFWRHEPPCKTPWDEDRLTRALDNCKLTPVADPNVPSHMHRLMKVIGLIQMASHPVFGPYVKPKETLDWAFKMLKYPESLIGDPPAQGEPPQDLYGLAKMIEAMAKKEELKLKEAKLMIDAKGQDAKTAEAAAARQSKENIATLDLAKSLVIHQDSREDAQGNATHQRGLDVRKDAREAGQAAHSTAMDVHNAMNPPQPQRRK